MTIKNLFYAGIIFCTGSIHACNNEEPIYTDGNVNIPSIDNPMGARWQEAMNKFRIENKIPGIQAAIISPATNHKPWLNSSGFANLEKRELVKDRSQFRIASITKTFVATIVMQLKSEGKINLDAVLTDYLPEMAGQIDNAKNITLRQMLNHSSGTHDYQDDFNYRLDIFNNPMAAQQKGTRGLLKSFVFGKKGYYAPGSGWSYSNTDYLLLQLIIETVEGQPLQNVMHQRIFEPLGMTNTYFESRKNANLVRGYRDLYDKGFLVDTYWWDFTDEAQGDGGIVSTALDISVFSEALFAGKIINSELISEMRELLYSQRDCPQFCHYGLGLQVWTVSDNEGWGHAGGAYGFATWMFYFPKYDLHLVLLTNRGNFPPLESINALIDELMK